MGNREDRRQPLVQTGSHVMIVGAAAKTMAAGYQKIRLILTHEAARDVAGYSLWPPYDPGEVSMATRTAQQSSSLLHLSQPPVVP
jgi:hypothetical protein